MQNVTTTTRQAVIASENTPTGAKQQTDSGMETWMNQVLQQLSLGCRVNITVC